MRQFFEGSDEAWTQLARRSTGRCIRFRDQEMPPGCVPDRASVGFEVDDGSGTARLLVTRGIRYSGDNQTVRRWFEDGEKEFRDFAGLQDWVHGALRRAFGVPPAAESASVDQCASRGTELTDMVAVHHEIQTIDVPLYLDEDRFFERLRSRIIGQDDALRALCSVTVRHVARRRPARPAVLFAVGPSGVGKTRTAEIMAEVLQDCGDEGNAYQFLRLDMTEYQEAHRVSQLIGSPQGYIGHNDGSQLLNALRANSRTIVLFDEIEKAHPAILRVLMNAMDAGRLSTATSASGSHEVDCRNAVFIFTTNQDAKSILDELESRNAFGDRAIEDEVCRRRLHAAGIAPEIVGRIGRFLVYRTLSQQARATIVALAVSEVAKEYGLNVTYIEPSVIVEVMRQSRSEGFGIRPEKFLIDDMLGGTFAEAAKQGGRNIVVSGPPFSCQLCLVGAECDDGESDNLT